TKTSWLREAGKMGIPKDQIAVVNKKGDSLSQAPIVVTNYERLGSVVDEALPWNMLILDEAHSIKEYSSNRTRAAFQVGAKAKRISLLTGTPLLNREDEIH